VELLVDATTPGGKAVGIAFEDNIQDVLSAFGLPRASEWRLLPKSAAKRDELVKVSFADHRPVLIRFHDPGYYRPGAIDCQTLFRSRLHAGGVPVPALYRHRAGRFLMDLTWRREIWTVTVEEWIDGEPPHFVTPSLVSILGRTLGKMHVLVGGYGPLFGHGTDLSLFGHRDEYHANAGRLRKALEGLGLEMPPSLEDAYKVARGRLAGLWDDLPAGPVHGDLAEHNLLLDETENVKAVLDFNLAGDEVFINEVVHTCLRLPSFGDESHDRAYTTRFLRAYEEVRPLSVKERLAAPYLVTVIRPFRLREVRRIEEAARHGDVGTILRHLNRLTQLADPYRAGFGA
jgi:Ser/Thr protein kinase RdoA (MazF antagonist)